jgi:hypothetical protein
MSEIARLRRQVELECQVMRLALYGYASVASHAAIEQKYKALGKHLDALEQLVGPEEADAIVTDTYIRVVG